MQSKAETCHHCALHEARQFHIPQSIKSSVWRRDVDEGCIKRFRGMGKAYEMEGPPVKTKIPSPLFPKTLFHIFLTQLLKGFQNSLPFPLQPQFPFLALLLGSSADSQTLNLRRKKRT